MTWHAAAGANHAKTGTGHWALQPSSEGDSHAVASTTALHLCFYMCKSIFIVINDGHLGVWFTGVLGFIDQCCPCRCAPDNASCTPCTPVLEPHCAQGVTTSIRPLTTYIQRERERERDRKQFTCNFPDESVLDGAAPWFIPLAALKENPCRQLPGGLLVTHPIDTTKALNLL